MKTLSHKCFNTPCFLLILILFQVELGAHVGRDICVLYTAVFQHHVPAMYLVLREYLWNERMKNGLHVPFPQTNHRQGR